MLNRMAPLAVCISMLCSACVEVNGGAVEAGWDLRFPNGRRVDESGNQLSCSQTGLGALGLELIPVQGGEDPCASLEECRFGCSVQDIGITGFIIPPGEYAMRLQVLDDAGAPLGVGDGVTTPGAVVRRVNTGEITSLSVNLIIIDR